MGGQMRVYRQRIRSVSATKKITKAMELIAASRVIKAREAVMSSAPYTHALTRAVSAAATYAGEEHPSPRIARVVGARASSSSPATAVWPVRTPRRRSRPPTS